MREYKLLRSARRTVSLEIRPDGSLLVRAPKRMADADIRQFVADREHWIEKHLRAREGRTPTEPLTDGELYALAEQAADDLPRRVARLAPLVGVRYGRITVRNQKTRWGSCSSAGNLNFNCLLMLTPEAVRDYVVVHELCHRLEMNHSPRFWAQVERVLPNYREQRRWLKTHGGGIIQRMTERSV